mgnify:CR=1 FL=1
MKQPRNPRRLVVKVGTSTSPGRPGASTCKTWSIWPVYWPIWRAWGYQPVLVSSGAIGIGTKKLRLGERPTELRMKQAAAAVGPVQDDAHL